MRVLHVIPNLVAGGAQRVALTLIREQQKHGLTVKLCVIGTENAFPSRVPEGCDPLFLHYGGSWRKPVQLGRCLRRVRSLVKQFQPDIVHSHLWPAVHVAMAATRGLSCKHVVHIQDTRPWLAGRSPRNKMWRAVTKALLRRTRTTFVCVSEAVRAYTHQHLPLVPADAPIVFNGLDAEEGGVDRADHGLPGAAEAHSSVIGAAGRLSVEKGHSVLLAAAAELKRRGRSFQVRIAGEGVLLDDLLRETNLLDLSDEVSFTGLVEDMNRFYNSLGIFALPSIGMEGLPVVLLEAMAHALPIVATDVPGPPEAIRHGKEGLLVRAGDTQALADALDRLLLDQELRARLGASAAERVRDRFTGKAMAEGVGRAYRLALEGGAGAATFHEGQRLESRAQPQTHE